MIPRETACRSPANFLATLAIGILLAAFATNALSDSPTPPAASVTDLERTAELLDRAEAHYRELGERALAGFSQSGEFVDNDLYVYVLDFDGQFLASGGASATLIGRNVRDMTDASGKAFFREMIEGAATRGSGRVDYRWFNPATGRSEPKIASYRAVDNLILAVGYYAPRASVELARSLLWRAVHEFKSFGSDAFPRFNSLNGGFIQDDLYVFVIGVEDGFVYAHGGSPRQIGRSVLNLTDAEGKLFIREMIDSVAEAAEADVQYAWRNPLTMKVERKHTYLVRVGNYLIGAGAYIGPAR